MTSTEFPKTGVALRVLTPIMSELTRARDDDMDDDLDSFDSLDQAQWRGIQARIETLKVDDDTKPPTDSSPPIKSDDESVGGNDPRDMGLVAKYVGLKHKVKTLTKENKDLKREIEEMNTKPPPPIESASIESASPPAVYLKFKINNRKKEELHFLCLQDEEELEEYGDGSAWDWPEKHLQLDYTDVDLEPDIEEITKEEYEKNATTAYSYCFIRDLTPEERATYKAIYGSDSNEDDDNEDDDDGACVNQSHLNQTHFNQMIINQMIINQMIYLCFVIVILR